MWGCNRVAYRTSAVGGKCPISGRFGAVPDVHRVSRRLLQRTARIISSSWPATQCVPNAITITFSTGYGDPEDVPDGIKLAMLLLVDHWWSNRSAVITGTISKPMEFAVDSLLTPFKWRVK